MEPFTKSKVTWNLVNFVNKIVFLLFTFGLGSSFLFTVIPSASAIGAVATEIFLTRKFEAGHKSVTVNEGENLPIFCSIAENSTASEADINGVSWSKDGVELNLTDLPNPSDSSRVTETTTLGFSYVEALATDRGWYRCTAEYNNRTQSATFQFYVRVKSKFLPLWPFLGICGQVIFLGALLCVYEKRRSKDELEEQEIEESDTGTGNRDD